jgi:outer membrane biosynthesis protein TonB
MPTSPFQIDPEQPRPEGDGAELQPAPAAAAEPDSNAPLSFVPHDAGGARAGGLRSGRYGELDEHELLHLLDSIEDERAKARFRESIYLSVFVWLVVAWVVLYGPRYLWHGPTLVNPADVLRQRELVQLNSPVLSPKLRTPAPRPAPKLDNKTLDRLRAMKPTPQPSAPTPPVATQPLPSTPAPSVPAPSVAVPSAPAPRTPPVVAEAPTPQPSTRPNFGTQGSASDAIQQAIQEAAKNRNGGGGGVSLNGGGRGTQLGQGVDILSDTKGVNFQPYLQRILRQIYEQWLPLIPEEARPPLSKQGVTQIRFSIGPDGTVLAMHLDGSTHDDALNRAAWGSINGQQFPPLPKQFTGPLLELRIHYLVNKQTE